MKREFLTLLLIVLFLWPIGLISQMTKGEEIIKSLDDLPLSVQIDSLTFLAGINLYKDKELSTTLATVSLDLARDISYTKAEAKSLGILGSLDYLNDNNKLAIEKFKEAGKLNLLEKDSIEFVKNKSNEALMHFYLGSYDIGEAIYLECLVFDSLRKDWQGLAITYNNLGLIHKAQGRYADAASDFQKAYRLDKSRRDNKGMASALTNLGTLYRRTEHLDSAQKYLEMGLELFVRMNDSLGIARNLNNQGLIHKLKGDDEQAMKLFTQSLDIKEKQGGLISRGNALINMANLLSNYGLWDQALTYHMQVLDIFRGTDYNQKLAMTLGNIGAIYCNQSACEKSIPFYHEALQVLNRDRNSQNELRAQIYSELCSAYSELDELDSAMNYCQRSLDLLESQQKPNKKELAVTFRNIGEILFGRGEIEKAFSHLKKAEQISKELDHPEENKRISLVLANYYLALRDFEKAYMYQHIYSQLADSLKTVQSAIAMRRVEAKFQVERQKRNLAEKVQELEVQKRIALEQKLYTTIALLVLLIIMVFAVHLYKRFKHVRIEKIQLEDEYQSLESDKQQVEELNETLTQEKKSLDQMNQSLLADRTALQNSTDLYKQKVIHLKNYIIPIQEIRYIKSLPKKKKVRIRTTKEDYEEYIPLGKILDKLPPSMFVRNHQSYIVNLHYVEYKNKGIIYMKLFGDSKERDELPVGRQYKISFNAALAKFHS